VAELRAIEGGRGKPVAVVVEVLREQLARAEAGELREVLVVANGRDGSSIAAALSNPWEVAGIVVLEVIPFLQQEIEEVEE
jgi:hypothetical protein